MLVPFLLLLVPAAAPSPLGAMPAAGPDRESAFAWRATRQGRMMPLKEVERRVIPLVKGAQYIGFSLDMDSAIYTLKFLRNGAVIWVDVDGRSGQVIGRTDQ